MFGAPPAQCPTVNLQRRRQPLADSKRGPPPDGFSRQSLSDPCQSRRQIRWGSWSRLLRDILRVGLRFLAGKNPIDTPAGVSLELQENFGRRGAQPQLVLRQLGLGDAQDLTELDLGQIKSADFPDAAPDGREVGSDPF